MNMRFEIIESSAFYTQHCGKLFHLSGTLFLNTYFLTFLTFLTFRSKRKKSEPQRHAELS